jgi:hypothetical protein
VFILTLFSLMAHRHLDASHRTQAARRSMPRPR